MTDAWIQEHRWQVYLPEGQRYRLCIAVEGVENEEPTKPAQTLSISPGSHAVDLKEDFLPARRTWPVKVDSHQIVVEEPWDRQTHGSSHGGSRFGANEQEPAEQPLFLCSRIYHLADHSKTSRANRRRPGLDRTRIVTIKAIDDPGSIRIINDERSQGSIPT